MKAHFELSLKIERTSTQIEKCNENEEKYNTIKEDPPKCLKLVNDQIIRTQITYSSTPSLTFSAPY